MHFNIHRLDADIVAVWSGEPLTPAERPLSARAQHARFLDIAAARRRRAVDRAVLGRFEDADYWKQSAPAAVTRAMRLRASSGFNPLP